MTLNTYQEKWRQIPAAVKQFLLRGLLLLVVWKVLYLAVLLPTRLLDAPLTDVAGKLTAAGLNVFTHSANYHSKNESGLDKDVDSKPIWVMQRSIYFNNHRLVGIYDGCNALELFVLYAGFIVCMPAPVKKKWTYIASGTVLVFIVNILRCVGITYLIQYHPAEAEFAHHFLFVFIVYALIIVLWLMFTKNINVKNNG